MPSKSPPHLSADELDDLLYFSRAGSLPDFQATISTSSKRLNTPPHTILLAAVDDTSRNSALHMASANGHTELLIYALSLLPSPTPNTTAGVSAILDAHNAAGNTPLHWAALNGHLEAVKVLVGAGADVRVRNGAGREAVGEAEGGGRGEVVEWLLMVGRGVDGGVEGEEREEGDVDAEEREVGEGVEGGKVGEGRG